MDEKKALVMMSQQHGKVSGYVLARYWLTILDFARERYGDDHTAQRVPAAELRALCEAVLGKTPPNA